MDMPKRKTNRLQGYDYSQNGAYFVTVCTYNRVRLFGEIKSNTVGATLCGRPNNPDRIIEKRLHDVENKYPNVIIDKFIVMPDHIHLILRIENTGDHTGSPLREIIGWFKTMTTNDYIKGVKEGLFPPFDKHVWQRSYYEHIIRNEQDYEETWYYIEYNPIKWLETKSMTCDK